MISTRCRPAPNPYRRCLPSLPNTTAPLTPEALLGNQEIP